MGKGEGGTGHVQGYTQPRGVSQTLVVGCVSRISARCSPRRRKGSWAAKRAAQARAEPSPPPLSVLSEPSSGFSAAAAAAAAAAEPSPWAKGVLAKGPYTSSPTTLWWKCAKIARSWSRFMPAPASGDTSSKVYPRPSLGGAGVASGAGESVAPRRRAGVAGAAPGAAAGAGTTSKVR